MTVNGLEDTLTIQHHHTTSHHHHHHRHVPGWFLNTTHTRLPFERLKLSFKLLLLSLTKPRRSFLQPPSSHSPERSRSARSRSPLPARSRSGPDSVCSVRSWWQVHDGSCRRSRKAERGVSTRTRRRHHMISQQEFCLRACRRRHTVFRNLKTAGVP